MQRKSGKLMARSQAHRTVYAGRDLALERRGENQPLRQHLGKGKNGRETESSRQGEEGAGGRVKIRPRQSEGGGNHHHRNQNNIIIIIIKTSSSKHHHQNACTFKRSGGGERKSRIKNQNEAALCWQRTSPGQTLHRIRSGAELPHTPPTWVSPPLYIRITPAASGWGPVAGASADESSSST